ncbi:MAG: YhdH/YhfP family quinone oxidoreductase [Mariprofundaceae bacterium]
MKRFRAFRIHDNQGRAGIGNMAADHLPAGDTLIEVRYSSVNYKDALAATGRGGIARRFPITGGIDMAGIVLESTDTRFQPGDEVICTGCGLSETLDGGYSEICRLPADILVPLPAGLSLFEAMALGTAGFTAALALHRMQQNGQRPERGPIAVSGATGGVGCIAINLLNKLGYTTVAITGKMEHGGLLASLGASEIMDRNALAMGVAPLEKMRWAGAMDAVGGDMLSWLARSIRPFGNVASYGMAGGTELSTSVFPFILRGVSILGITSASCPMPLRRELWAKLAGAWKPDQLDAIVRQRVELENLPNVFERVLNGRSLGRTVVKLHSS